MTANLPDRVLDALDDSGPGIVTGEATFEGSLATIQSLSAVLGCSDSATRRAVHALRHRGLVTVFDALDPASRRRRLYITGEARS